MDIKAPLDIKYFTIYDFYHSKYNSHHNLYIVKDGDLTLYVGISIAGIWSRWFGERGRIVINDKNKWFGLGDSISEAIESCYPKSMKWIIELRQYEQELFLDDIEWKLIQELRPLLNLMGRPEITEQEYELKKKYQFVNDEIEVKDYYESIFN